MNLLESVQYQAGLIISGCWKGTNKLKLYNELGWESLSERRKLHRLITYYKIKNSIAPEYLSEYVLNESPRGTNRFLNSYYPFCFNAWQTLDPPLKQSASTSIFKRKYISVMRPPKSNLLGMHDRRGTILLTRLRVDFSDLRLNRFNHNFN